MKTRSDAKKTTAAFRDQGQTGKHLSTSVSHLEDEKLDQIIPESLISDLWGLAPCLRPTKAQGTKGSGQYRTPWESWPGALTSPADSTSA